MEKEGIITILETPEFVAISKPAGVLVHAVRGPVGGRKPRAERPIDTRETVVDWVRARYPGISNVGDDHEERPGIVHRLDKDTSGVLIVARTQAFFDYLKARFQAHEVKKTYLALVWGRTPVHGIIDKPIGLKPGTVKRSTVARKMKMVKEAVTEYATVWTRVYGPEEGEYSLVRLTPKTGRTHQLRVHMASIGHPIVGDTLYSTRTNPWGLTRQFLHAESIEFSSPGGLPERPGVSGRAGKRVRIASDLPTELETIIKKLNPDN